MLATDEAFESSSDDVIR